MISFDFEDNREDYFDIVLIPVEKKSHIVDENAKRIKANKFLLSSASRFFKSLFTFGKEKFENEIQFEVLDVDISVMIINAIYKGSLMELLSRLSSADEKMVMISMCSRFELKINYDDMLRKIEVDSSSIGTFVNLLNELGKSTQNYIEHITKHLTHSDELSNINDDTYNYIRSYIDLNFIVSYDIDYFCVCNMHDGVLSSITTEKAFVIGFRGDTVLLSDCNQVTSFNIKTHNKNIELNLEENKIFVSNDIKLLAIVSSDSIVIHEVGTRNDKVIEINNLCDNISNCIFTQDNSKIIVYDRCNLILVWDIETTSLLNMFNIFDPSSRGIKDVVSIPNSDEIVILLHSGINFSVWNTKTSKKVYDSETSPTEIGHICVSPDGKRVATNQMSKTVIIWENGHIIHTLSTSGEYGSPGPIAYSPFREKLISTSVGYINVINADDGSLIKVFSINSKIDILLYSQ